MSRLITEIEADIVEVRCAIRKMISGERLVATDLAGRVEQYANVRLSELQEQLQNLLNERSAVMLAGEGRGVSRIFRTSHSKGL